MDIYNDYRALDSALRAIEEQVGKLQVSSQLVNKDLEQLQNKGWQDKNYQNLREVMQQHHASLQLALNGLESLKNELIERSNLIKKYHSIPF
jgi:hypothetical protein